MSTSQPKPERITVGGFARPPWSAIDVGEVMRGRVLTCLPDAPLAELARRMVTHHIHAVVVVDSDDDEGGYVTGIVTDESIARAGLEGGAPVARDLAVADAPTIPIGWSVEQAAEEMLRRGSSHVIVIDGRGAPVGMLSTLDFARLVAWGHP